MSSLPLRDHPQFHILSRFFFGCFGFVLAIYKVTLSRHFLASIMGITFVPIRDLTSLICLHFRNVGGYHRICLWEVLEILLRTAVHDYHEQMQNRSTANRSIVSVDCRSFVKLCASTHSRFVSAIRYSSTSQKYIPSRPGLGERRWGSQEDFVGPWVSSHRFRSIK